MHRKSLCDESTDLTGILGHYIAYAIPSRAVTYSLAAVRTAHFVGVDMLNWLWAGMIGIGMIWAGFHGNLAAVTDGALSAAKEAVDLCILMAGVMGMWCGLMEIADKSSLLAQLNRLLQPLLRFLFPYIPEDHSARTHISTNIVANMLGLGWAATPAGLQAMEALAQLEEERAEGKAVADSEEPSGKKQDVKTISVSERSASDEMCTFLVLNISSLQLMPVNVIAYRAQYGSVNPAAVTGPALVATLVSTLTGIVFCKIMCRKIGHNPQKVWKEKKNT